MSTRTLISVYSASLMVLLSACTGLSLQPKTPEISLTGLQIEKVGLDEQRFRIQLRLHNPNNFALPVRSLDYALQINGQKFAEGASTRPVTVPALGESELELKVAGRLQDALPQIVALGTGSALNYRLSGNIGLSDFLVKIPFNKEGKVSLRP